MNHGPPSAPMCAYSMLTADTTTLDCLGYSFFDFGVNDALLASQA